MKLSIILALLLAINVSIAVSQQADSVQFIPTMDREAFPTSGGSGTAPIGFQLNRYSYDTLFQVISLEGSLWDKRSRPLVSATVVVGNLRSGIVFTPSDSTQTDSLGNFKICSRITDKDRAVLSLSYPGHYEYRYYLRRLVERAMRK